MDLSTLKSRVITRLSLDTNDPLYSNVEAYINEALHLIETASSDGWPWLRTEVSWTLTASDNAYAFTDLSSTYTISKILSVRIQSTDGYWEPLTYLTFDESQYLYDQHTTETGTPEYYNVENQTLYLYPTPNAAFSAKARIVYGETDLGGSGSSPVLPARFHTSIIDTALMLAYEELGDERKFAMYQGKFSEGIERMRRNGNEFEAKPRIFVREEIWWR